MHHAATSMRTENDDRHAERLRSVALSMIVARRALNGPLPSGMLHDFPLDVLLRLFIAGDAAVTVEYLQVDIGVGDTVLRRWLAALEHEHMIVSHGRNAELTRHGRESMERALQAVIQSQVDLFGTAHHA